jgi:hypothetical protein
VLECACHIKGLSQAHDERGGVVGQLICHTALNQSLRNRTFRPSIEYVLLIESRRVEIRSQGNRN